VHVENCHRENLSGKYISWYNIKMLLDYFVRKSLDWIKLAHDSPAARLGTRIRRHFPHRTGDVLLTQQLSACSGRLCCRKTSGTVSVSEHEYR
jgi:hypothetical protein